MAKVRNEAELRATLDETPTTPPEDVTNYLKTLMDSSILIFKVGYQPDFLTGMKHKAVEVHCTHCGETYYLDYTFYVISKKVRSDMYFKLKILYNDNTLQVVTVKRVSDISSNSDWFYYEEPSDMRGRGKCLEKKKIKCFECEPLSSEG